MSEAEARAEFNQLQRRYSEGAPAGFWYQAGRKFGEALHQGLATVRAFLQWLRDEFRLFWNSTGREIAFTALAVKMTNYAI